MTIRELLTKELNQSGNINSLLKSTFEINRELQNHFNDLYTMALDEPTEGGCRDKLQSSLYHITGTIAELSEAAQALQNELEKMEALKKALESPQIDETAEVIPF